MESFKVAPICYC